MRLGVPYDRAVRRALRTLFPVLVLALAGIAGGAVHAQPPAGDGMAAPPQPAAGDRAGLTTPHELGHYAGVVPGQTNRPPAMPRDVSRRPNRIVTWPGFQARADGASRFFVQTTSAVQPSTSTTPGRVTITLPNVRIHLSNNHRPLETRFFNTPVARARVQRRGRNTLF